MEGAFHKEKTAKFDASRIKVGSTLSLVATLLTSSEVKIAGTAALPIAWKLFKRLR